MSALYKPAVPREIDYLCDRELQEQREALNAKLRALGAMDLACDYFAVLRLQDYRLAVKQQSAYDASRLAERIAVLSQHCPECARLHPENKIEWVRDGRGLGAWATAEECPECAAVAA